MKRNFKCVSRRMLSIILAMLMVMSTMLIGTLSVSAASTAKIYFDNSGSNWSTVSIWAWDDSDNYTGGSWPGKTMTSEGNNIYSFELNINAKYVIFNNSNNGKQTEDITLPNDWTTKEKIYKSDGSYSNRDGSAPDDATVYFKNTDNWSNVYVHYWGGTEATTWPGKTMTKVDGTDDIYSCTFPNNNTNIIFHNNGSGDANQTSDITVKDGYLYTWVTGGKDKNKDANWSAEPYSGGGSDLTDGAITLKDKTPVNGSLSFKAEGKTAGTADVGDTVTITATPFSGFSCNNITVSYIDTGAEEVNQDLTVTDNTANFTVPDVNADQDGVKKISFAASFTLNKESYLSSKGDGLWIDVAPTQNDSTATLIKWNNYEGNKHNTTTNPYTFYVPKNVALSNAQIYNGYNSAVTVNGTTINAKSFGNVNLSVSNNISISGAYTGKIKVMQGSTNAMFLYTTNKGNETALRTKTYADWDAPASSVSKADEKTDGGSCKTMTNDSENVEFSSAMSLESVKGRGNSSWEASAKRFGKYAYNMKLSEKTTLFGMAKDTKKAAGSKSWCLLANNADESMLRNALAYKLANDVGLYSSPEFSFVDIYDNGEYLGQYLITEKVDVGTSKLVYGESIEDVNEDAGLVFDEDSRNVVNATYNGKNYSYCYTTETTGAASPDISKATYLLEFEIEERYISEACWFTTPEGQHVVIKTPEFATQEQVKFIAEKFIDMETAVFANSTNLKLSDYMDLDSFARMYLIQEISSNLDAASTSYYVTYDCSKGTNARFVASPVWDYDWAFGQYGNSSKYDVNGAPLNPKNASAWYAKNKKYDDSSESVARKYSIQSKLANNTSFQQVIKKVWEGTDAQEGFYAKVKKYYGNNSQLDQWFNKISASVNMNETRWGFIASDLISDWGSSNTGDTHAAAVNYLENDFLATRANWLNGQFESYPEYTQIASPTLTAYQSDGKTELTTDVEVGTPIVFKTVTTESFVTYELYKDNVRVSSNTTGVFEVKADSKGTFDYTVKTVYGTNNTMTSNNIPVTVTGEETAVLKSVSLTAPSSAAIGSTITLTATPVVEGTATEITYTYYMSDDAAVGGDTKIKTDTETSITANVPETAGTYYYYVTATLNGTTVTSTFVPVKVEGPTELTGVSLTASSSEVVVNKSFTINAAVTPADITGCKFTYYRSTDNVISEDDKVIVENKDSKTVVVSIDTVGTYYYYVKAVCGDVTKYSDLVPVTATEQQGTHTVKVWFKSASAFAYVPSVSLDGGSYVTMNKNKIGTADSTYIGSSYTGSLKFYWYYADIEVDSTKTHTFTFKTAETSVRATSESSNFNNSEYYFAVDNLMDDTNLVDLTQYADGEHEYILNYHRTATCMTTSGIVPGDSTLGFTWVDGKEYAMGQYIKDYVNTNSIATASTLSKTSPLAVGAGYAQFTIDSATLAQKCAADIADVSTLQLCLLDVNLDGKVDIADTTLMQKALTQ